MKTFTYFQINNINFNYTLEFQTNNKNDMWKINAPLIDYCETIGVNIPHYCYHKNLSISGNCRMCLVELKNSPKPIVSCSMSAKSCLNNGAVFTNSPLVKKARENVLEFLLLNHPLDCPICDQGGECDLQDQSFFFGVSKKRFYNFKRIVTDKNLGLIVKTVMTRCIHCTRCVRFADEIAGIPSLGMFGRGLNSEIGTYVKKTFQSELSGNVIDLCPVGALTSKPYPFVNRSWELKNIPSIDYCDGLGNDLQIYIKNNKIIKIQPSYNQSNQAANWISDKTRFSFDGMFSSNRILNGFTLNNKKQNIISVNWSTIFTEIVDILYFHDQLSRHFFKTNKLVFIFDDTLNIETLTLLTLLTKKFSFISLRKSINSPKNVDLSTALSLKITKSKLQESDLCVLIGTNPRYECSNLNTLLRQRHLKGNFEIKSIGGLFNPTFPINYEGHTEKVFQSLIEGTHPLCQKLLQFKNPMLILNSNFVTKKNNTLVLNCLELLENKLKNYSKNCSINLINLSINETGVNYLNTFKTFTLQDLKDNNGLYFLNVNSAINLNLKKIINAKLLLSDCYKTPKYCFEHSQGQQQTLHKKISKDLSVYNYINLPNTTNYESTNTYLTTENKFKTQIKFLPSPKHTKEDWQIIRKFFQHAKQINFTNNFSDNNLLSFNNKTLTKYNNFLYLMYLSGTKLINNNKLILIKNLNKTKFTVISNLKIKKTKTYTAKIKLWLNDFYIGGKDSHSRFSVTMIKCSKQLRSETTNFNYNV